MHTLGRPRGVVPAWALLLLAACPAIAGATGGGRSETAPAADSSTAALEGLPIARIVIDPRAIFDPVPKGIFSGAYSAANLLHVRTRPSTIRSQLLFEEGQPWSTTLARETERNLRALHFVEVRPIVATRRGDSVDVRVVTQDTWTTQPSVRIYGADGKRFGSVSLLERNLLGIGKSFEIERGDGPSGRSSNFLFDDPNLFGSRMRGRTYFQSGSAGTMQSFSLGLPFYAEASRRSYSLSWYRHESPARLYQDGLEVGQAWMDVEEASASWGFGWKSGGTVRRLAFLALGRDRTVGSWTGMISAPPSEQDRVRRVGAQFRLWMPRYVAHTAVDHLDRVEDFDVGTSLRIEVGEGLRAFGSLRDETYVSLGLDQGLDAGTRFGLLSASGSARLGGGEAREVLVDGRARWIDQTLPLQTLVFGATMRSGSRMPSGFQAVSGSLDGLRGYPVYAVAGDHLLQLNVEDRIVIARNVGQLASFGAAAFYDAARARGPGGADTGWHHSAGAGLRVSLPRSTRDRVMRFDVAWPLHPSRDGRNEPVLSFGADQAF
jgi:hypothetical protein